jgi:hypothetical protein
VENVAKWVVVVAGTTVEGAITDFRHLTLFWFIVFCWIHKTLISRQLSLTALVLRLPSFKLLPLAGGGHCRLGGPRGGVVHAVARAGRIQ